MKFTRRGLFKTAAGAATVASLPAAKAHKVTTVLGPPDALPTVEVIMCGASTCMPVMLKSQAQQRQIQEYLKQQLERDIKHDPVFYGKEY